MENIRSAYSDSKIAELKIKQLQSGIGKKKQDGNLMNKHWEKIVMIEKLMEKLIGLGSDWIKKKGKEIRETAVRKGGRNNE